MQLAWSQALRKAMQRRDFMKVVACSAVTWPLAARAQQSMRVIGFLDRGSPVAMAANLAAFQKGLAENGYNEGNNVRIEYRWAEGKNDRLPALAAELVRLPVGVIAATRTSAPAMAAKAATSTIPIVFETGSDPVKDGLAVSTTTTPIAEHDILYYERRARQRRRPWQHRER
jgi:putative tryptophan/tyrosine transport system substrate-binding protein